MSGPDIESEPLLAELGAEGEPDEVLVHVYDIVCVHPCNSLPMLAMGSWHVACLARDPPSPQALSVDLNVGLPLCEGPRLFIATGE